MKTARLIKRNEIQATATQPQQPVNTIKPLHVVKSWTKEKERATPTQARRAFAALFSVPTGQVSW